MGVRKWTSEEEAALKAGVVKHGSGKWRTILEDPEFSAVLFLRSNVDLKDKWRNMSAMGYGSGGRDKSKVSLKRVPVLTAIPKLEEMTITRSTSASDGTESDEEMVDVKPLDVSSLVVSSAPMEIATTPKRSIVRLDNLILEAITNLKEPGGSNETAIASYIEEASEPSKRKLENRRKSKVAENTSIETVKKRGKEKAQTDLPLSENATNRKRKAQEEAPRASKRKLMSRGNSLYAAGTIIEEGRRRSTRIKMRPLEYCKLHRPQKISNSYSGIQEPQHCSQMPSNTDPESGSTVKRSFDQTTPSVDGESASSQRPVGIKATKKSKGKTKVNDNSVEAEKLYKIMAMFTEATKEKMNIVKLKEERKMKQMELDLKRLEVDEKIMKNNLLQTLFDKPQLTSREEQLMDRLLADLGMN